MTSRRREPPRRPRHRRVACLVWLLGAVGAAGRDAKAVEEETWQLSLGAGVTSVAVDGRRPLGGLLAVDAAYGLTDAWALRGALDVSLSPVSSSAPGEREGLVTATSATAGLMYAIDVLRVVPFAFAGVGIFGVGGAVEDARGALGVEGGLGADYVVGRRWSVGVLARYQYFPLEFAGDGEALETAGGWLRLARPFD